MDVAPVNDDQDWTLAELRLLCTESLTARRATVSCHDKRVLHELLHIDDRYVVSSSPYVNSNITVHMRTQLAEWIFEVTTQNTQNRIEAAATTLNSLSVITKYTPTCYSVWYVKQNRRSNTSMSRRSNRLLLLHSDFRTQAKNTSTTYKLAYTNIAYDPLPYKMASATLTVDSNRK